MKILIADDSTAMRMVVQRTIERAGFTGHIVVQAAGGEEALQLADQEKPGLILCDWNMPDLDGIEVLKRLREQKITTPFGFVTSEATPDMLRRGAELGADFHICKPFTVETFKKTLSDYVK